MDIHPMMAGQTTTTRSARVLLATPLQNVLFPVLSSRYDTVVPVANRSDLEKLTSGSLMIDVAIVDLLWGSLESPPDFDGLDVLDHLERNGRVAAALITIHGQYFEHDFLDEIMTRPIVKGAMFKGEGVPALLERTERLARGHRDLTPALPPRFLDGERLTIDNWFRSRPLVAHVAGAIASGQATTWKAIAEVTSYQKATVESTPRLFAEAMYSLGEIDDITKVNQAVVFRWVGEHAQYILSWCRRNGMEKYRRERDSRG